MAAGVAIGAARGRRPVAFWKEALRALIGDVAGRLERSRGLLEQRENEQDRHDEDRHRPQEGTEGKHEEEAPGRGVKAETDLYCSAN